MNFVINEYLSNELYFLIENIKPGYTELSVAIITDIENKPELVVYRDKDFHYPASINKIFIAAEVLRQIDVGIFQLTDKTTINSNNIVGDPRGIYPKQKENFSSLDTQVSLDFLLETMLGQSSNTSANVLIDLVGRESINEQIIKKYSWFGSEITRKFLSREREDNQYKNAPITKSNALHIAEFLYLVEKDKLINEYVSSNLRRYMANCNDSHKLSLAISDFQNYYHKIGSFETNILSYGFKFAFKSLLRGNLKKERWQNDAGVFSSHGLKHSICIFTHSKTFRNALFPMQMFSKKLTHLLKQR